MKFDRVADCAMFSGGFGILGFEALDQSRYWHAAVLFAIGAAFYLYARWEQE